MHMGELASFVFIRAYPLNPRSDSLVFVFPYFKIFAARQEIERLWCRGYKEAIATRDWN
jgi:hypothetical protein